LSYTLAFPQPHTHLYEVTFTIGNVAQPQLDIALPVWTPGSYLVREYARHVQDFAATDENRLKTAQQKLQYPQTRKVDHVDAYHGVNVADP
jgi:predicted metalloprotease with PDZ domain